MPKEQAVDIRERERLSGTQENERVEGARPSGAEI